MSKFTILSPRVSVLCATVCVVLGTAVASQAATDLTGVVLDKRYADRAAYVVGNVLSDHYDGQFIGDPENAVGTGNLDECNGMTAVGQHGSYVTADYPYALTCFSGTPSQEFQ